MVSLFLRIFDFLQQRRRLCISLMITLIAVLVAMMASLKYNENIYDFLPMSANEQKAITVYQDISGGQRIVALFKTKEGAEYSADRLTEAVDTFQQQLMSHAGSRHVRELTTQVDFEKLSSITDFVYSNMPLLLCDSDYVRMEQLLATPDFADEQLANDVQMIMMPATGYFTTSISNDPLGFFSPVMERLQSRQASLPFEIDNGYIFSPGGKYAIAMLTSPYGSMESANNGLLVNYVDSVCKVTSAAVSDVEVDITGSPVIAVGNASQIKNDSQWAISISVTLILLLLVFSFRKVKNLLLIGFAIIFGWLFAMGFIAVLRSDVSLIVLGIGSIIIGIAVNYPLHFIAHTDHGGTVREVLKDMVSPLLIGNITTVGAFAALMPLDAPALRDLGLFAAFMLIGTIFFVLIFLPHLVKQRAEKGEERLSFGRLSSVSFERHRWMMWVILLLTIVFGYYSLDTSFDANMHHINYMTPKQKELLGELSASAGLNDTTNIYVVTEGNSWNEALTRRSSLSPVIDSLQQAGSIRRASNVTQFISSEEQQAEKIARWKNFWQAHRDEVMQLLAQQAPLHGFSSDAFSDFQSIVDANYEPHSFDYFDPIISTLLNSSFSHTDRNYSVVDVINVDSKDIPALESLLNSRLTDSGYAFDFMGMNSSVANSLSDDFNYIGFACGLIVFVFLWLSFGRIELSMLAFIPMAVGWIWILGMMSMLGMQFNIVNVILATFIFGQGDDYTIFMTDGLINEYAYKKKLLPSYKNSIIISALIMFIGMGSLIVARHPALYSLAQVTIVGMLTVVMMAWIVPPLIYGWLVRTEGQTRLTPVTLEQIIRTIYCTICYLIELLYGCILGFFMHLMPCNKKSGRAWLSRVIHRTMHVNIHHIWGVNSFVRNEHNETFSRGSILICNHTSILDPIYMLALDPHVLMIISGKVWKNPVVHLLFRVAGFINLDQPMERLQAKISKAIDEGYNVVLFPEGMRTDGRIRRFHRGAFQMAQEIKADILPIYMHGAGHVMPKSSGFAARGRIDVEIGKRVTYGELSSYGKMSMEIAHNFHLQYVEHYADMQRRIEDTHYFHHYIIYKYTYKGIGLERETRRLLKQHDDFSQAIDNYTPTDSKSGVVSIVNAAHGQFSLMFALVHSETEVHSYVTDEDDYALAMAMEPMPENLHIHRVADTAEALQTAKDTNIINLSEII